MTDTTKQIDPNRALSVEGMAYTFFHLISRVARYKDMFDRLNYLKLDSESKKYLNEHKWNFNDFKAPTSEHSIMAEAILTKSVEKANQFYINLKKCFIDQFGPFWGQIHLNSIFLDYSTRKVFIREKILEIITSIASLPDKNKVIYFLNTGAGVDNTVQFVSKICQVSGIECRLIELDTPDMSEFKSSLVSNSSSSDVLSSDTPFVTYIPCDISQKQDIIKFIESIQELLNQDSGRNISLINLSEGLTPYITEDNMFIFNEGLKELSIEYMVEIYQIIDSIVWDENKNDSKLRIAKKYFDAFKSTVKDEKEFITKYGLGCTREKYGVFHPASEVTISREYKTVMLFNLLESKHIRCGESITIVPKDFNKEQLAKKLDEKELQVRQYYELLKEDQEFCEQVEKTKTVLSKAIDDFKEKEYNDFELVAKFNDIYKEKTGREFLDTDLAKSLFELSNACQSAKYLWNMTLAPIVKIETTPDSKSSELIKISDEQRKTEVHTKPNVANTFVEDLIKKREQTSSTLEAQTK